MAWVALMITVSACPVCRGRSLKSVATRTLRVQPPNGDDKQAFTNFMLDHVFQTAELTSSLLLCRTCYFVFYDKQPDPEEVGRLYNDQYLDNIRRYLPSWGASYDTDPAGTAANQQKRAEGIAERIRSAVPDWRPGSALDYGGSAGVNMRDFPPETKRYVYDLSATTTERGVEKLSVANEAGPYDFVMATHILEHVTDVRSHWDELTDLLATEGLLYVEVPLEFHYQLRRGRGVGENEHIQFFTQTSLKHLARATGMETLLLKPVNHPWPSGTMWSICGLFRKPAEAKNARTRAAKPWEFAGELVETAGRLVAGRIGARLAA